MSGAELRFFLLPFQARDIHYTHSGGRNTTARYGELFWRLLRALPLFLGRIRIPDILRATTKKSITTPAIGACMNESDKTCSVFCSRNRSQLGNKPMSKDNCKEKKNDASISLSAGSAQAGMHSSVLLPR